MKKFGKYFGNILSVYGLLTPLIVLSLVYVILISMERNDAVTALITNHKAWFIILLVLGVLTLAFCLVMLFKNLKSENINVGDLLLFIATLLGLLLLILFCFQPGLKTSWLSILKWIVAGIMFLGSGCLCFVRSRFAKNTEK